MIIDSHKLLFVHITKTGGQSITSFLLDNLGENPHSFKNPKYGLIPNKKFKIAGPEHYHHKFLSEYENVDDYFKFTVVRNPYERFCSAFYFRGLHKEYTYKEYTKIIPTITDNRTDEYRMFCPQVEYLQSSLTIDKIYKTENLNEVYTMLKNKYGFNKQPVVKNRLEQEKQNLDQYTRDFIKDYYKEDFTSLFF